jgi:hypothetical protein
MKLKISLSILTGLLLPLSALASSIVPQPWQPLINNADMVGGIECVTAGEIVARYRVVESWKGPKEGTILTVRGAADIYEPTLPIVLYGEQLLVAARKYRPEYRLATSLFIAPGPGGSLPPYWRDDRPDYFIPSSLHYTSLSRQPAEAEAGRGIIGGYRGDFDSFRREVREFLALPDESREAVTLRALIQWHIRDNRAGNTFSPDPIQVADLLAEASTSRVDSIVAAPDDFVQRGGRGADVAAFDVLYTGGGSHTLASLSALKNEHGAWRGSLLSSLSKGIRWRLGLDPPEDYNPIAIPPKPTGAALDSMRQLLGLSQERGSPEKSYGTSRDSRHAFEAIAVYDPEFLANYLRNWTRT